MADMAAREAPQRLGELLRELVELERQLASRLKGQRQLLIDGKPQMAHQQVAEVRRLCQAIAEVEARRQAWTARFCAERGLDAASARLEDLAKHPDLREQRQELLVISSQLRETLREVAVLRDEVQALAAQAKAYSDVVLQAIRDAARRGPYATAFRGGHFIDAQS